MSGENDLPDEDLEPDASLLGHTEMQALRELNSLCRRYGYGRVPQLAQHVRRLWERKLSQFGPGPWKPGWKKAKRK